MRRPTNTPGLDQRGILHRKGSGVTHANRSREFCVFLTRSCNESMWETSQRDLGLFWSSCAVAQLITHKNSPPDALSKYLSNLHSQISQASLSPTPSNSPESLGCSSSLVGNEKTRGRVYRNGKGARICSAHNTRTRLTSADSFWALERTASHFDKKRLKNNP